MIFTGEKILLCGQFIKYFLQKEIFPRKFHIWQASLLISKRLAQKEFDLSRK